MLNGINYLRISLLNNCNLKCFYCHPSNESIGNNNKNNFDLFCKSIMILNKLGINKIRFTGGEPTLYKKLPELISFCKSIDPSIKTCMTTNGVILKQKALTLSKTGLDSINISLDTVNENKFYNITGCNALSEVIDGIKTAKELIREVKLNCVLIRGVNDTEIEDMIQFADDNKIDIRFIEYMPTKHNLKKQREFVSVDEIISKLPFPLYPTTKKPSSAARYFYADKFKIKIGFINPVSHSFCASCNRIRLTSEGILYSCLFSSHSINLFKLIDNSENADEAIQQLAFSKKFVGCSKTDQDKNELPSFLNIGG